MILRSRTASYYFFAVVLAFLSTAEVYAQCEPMIISQNESNNCWGCPDDMLFKTVYYILRWPDFGENSLDVTAYGQWAYYYQNCEADTCTYYGEARKECWPQFNSPIYGNGYLLVTTSDNKCSLSYLPWCGVCSHKPRSASCSLAPSIDHYSWHNCTSCPRPLPSGCDPSLYDQAADFCMYSSSGCPQTGYLLEGDCCRWQNSPIVVDIEGDGFSLTSALGGVDFDFRAMGTKARISWTARDSDDAWLVLDRNGNGMIESGFEMFGNITEQPPSESPNGFLALAEFDKIAKGGNEDGVIDSQDAGYLRFRLWQDRNHNGLSEPNELSLLQQLGVAAIDLDYKKSRFVDAYGNAFRFRGKVHRKKRSDVGRWCYDVFLVVAK